MCHCETLLQYYTIPREALEASLEDLRQYFEDLIAESTDPDVPREPEGHLQLTLLVTLGQYHCLLAASL